MPHTTASELLGRVQQAARFGRIITTNHGRQQMAARGVQASDVENAIRTAATAIDQPDVGAVRVEGGLDVERDPIESGRSFRPARASSRHRDVSVN